MQLHLTAYRWESYGNITLCGNVYDGVKPCSLQQIAMALDVCNLPMQVAHCLQNLRGDFSVIIHKTTMACIAVSHTRLYPLFYRFVNNDWHITDNPANLHQKADVISPEACRQYLYTGAPLAGNTLVEGLKQGKPAYVTLFEEQRITTLPFGPYTAPIVTPFLEKIEADKAFETVLQTVFKRVLNSVANRQVVVPLSGGYDSRLVLAMLHKMGVKNVLCYTVGRHHPAEQGIAKQVADALQVPLYHIDYRDAQYRMQQFKSAAFARFVDTIGADGNFMWLFEYNAILWLKQQGLLQDNAVFIPGHVGDFYAGSHLSKLGIKEKESLQGIRRKLVLHAFEYGKPCWNTAFCADIKKALQNLPHHQFSWLVAMQFIAENRLAHQILNSARVYEFLGYQVLLPLCDVDFIQFFSRLPYTAFCEQSFYQEYLLKHVFEPLQIAFKKPTHAAQLRKQRLKNLLKPWVPRNLYLRRKKQQDVTTETYLLNDMLAELSAVKGVELTLQNFASGNEAMLYWYLNRVKNQLKTS